VTHHLREMGTKEKRISTHVLHKKGWHVKKYKGILRKIKVWHLCHSTKRKGYYTNEEVESYSNSKRVTHHLREMGTKEKIISIPMPQKKGQHVNIDKGVLRKIKVWHVCHLKKEKGVLRKWRGWNLCNSARVTRHLRAMCTNKMIISTPMSHKKGWHIKRDKVVVRKKKFTLVPCQEGERGTMKMKM
jgi:hypothetical protein